MDRNITTFRFPLRCFILFWLLQFLFYYIFTFIFTQVHICICVWINVCSIYFGACIVQMRASEFLKLELKMVETHPSWVLGTKVLTSRRTANAPNSWAISPASVIFYWYMKYCTSQYISLHWSVNVGWISNHTTDWAAISKGKSHPSPFFICSLPSDMLFTEFILFTFNLHYWNINV